MFPQYNYQQAASMWAAANAYNAYNQMQYSSMQGNFGAYNPGTSMQQQQQQQPQPLPQQQQTQQTQKCQPQQQPKQQQPSQQLQQPYASNNSQFSAMPGPPFSQQQSGPPFSKQQSGPPFSKQQSGSSFSQQQSGPAFTQQQSGTQNYFPQQNNYTQQPQQQQQQQQLQQYGQFRQQSQNNQMPNQMPAPQPYGQMGSHQYGQVNSSIQQGPPQSEVQQQPANWAQQQQTQQQNQFNSWNQSQNQQPWQPSNQWNQEQSKPQNQSNNQVQRIPYGGQQQNQWKNNRNISNQMQNNSNRGSNFNQPYNQNKMYRNQQNFQPQYNQNSSNFNSPHGQQSNQNHMRPLGMNQKPNTANSIRPQPLMNQFTAPGSNQGHVNQNRSLASETKQWVRTPHQNDPPQGPKPPQPYENAPPLPAQPPPPKEPPSKLEPFPQTSKGVALMSYPSSTPTQISSAVESDGSGEESLVSLTEQLETLETQIRMYQADYQKWHQEFIQWQKQHQNHPDQKQYIDYQKKYQKMIEEQQSQLKKQYADLQRKIGERKKVTKSSGAAKIAALNLKSNTTALNYDLSKPTTESIANALKPVPQGPLTVNAAPPVELPKQFDNYRRIEPDHQQWRNPNQQQQPQLQEKIEEKPKLQRKNPNNIVLRSTLDFVGVKCKFFPGCKYGNSCKFEHGICSIGKSCSNPSCPYEHPLIDVNMMKTASDAEAIMKMELGPVRAIQNLLTESSGDNNNKATVNEPIKTPTPDSFDPVLSRKRDGPPIISGPQEYPPAKTPRPSIPYTDEVKDPALRMRIDEIYEKRKREILGTNFQEPFDEYERRKREILGDGDALDDVLPPRPAPVVDEYERRRREILGDPYQDHSRADHLRDYRPRDACDVPLERMHDYRDLPPVRGDPYLPPRDGRYLPPDPYAIDRGRDIDSLYLERDMHERRREYDPFALPAVDREIRSYDYGHGRVEDKSRVLDPYLEKSRDNTSYLCNRPIDRPHAVYLDRKGVFDELNPVEDRSARASYDRSHDRSHGSLDGRTFDRDYRSERHDFDRRDPLERHRDTYDQPRDPYSIPRDFFEKSQDTNVRKYEDRHARERAGPSDYLRRIEERERERNERDGLRDYEMLYERDGLESSSKKPRESRIPESELKPEVVPAADILDMPGRAKRPNNVVIILRGIPGSGKSSVARLIKDKEAYYGAQPPRILALDDYFMQDTESQSGHSRSTDVKKQEYVYEAELEAAYRGSLLKAFNKTLSDGFFPMVIVDSINGKNKHYDQFWSDAKHKGFEVFIAELTGDIEECLERSIHKRPKEEVQKMLDGWEKAPVYYKRIDVSSLLQDAAIDEVEMEEAPSQSERAETDNKKEEDEDEELPTTFHIPKSKWESSKEETLAKLDGFTKMKVKSTESPIFPDEDEEEDDPYGEKEADMRLGRKRVRWADIEQKKHIDHQRKIGFSIGMDWKILTDPNAQIPK